MSSDRNTKSLKGAAAPSDVQKEPGLAMCGICCAACEVHLKGSQSGKKCGGCPPSAATKCAVYLCSKAKGIAGCCGLCPEFETCETLKKHHEKPLYRRVARRTCTRVKAVGLQAALAEQKARWTCKTCGKLFPWNTQGKCPHCGAAVEVMSEKDAQLS